MTASFRAASDKTGRNANRNETEELPPIDRAEPLVLELRLRILTALSQWELGASIANVLECSAAEPARCRETVARFHHARARYLCETGDYESARRRTNGSWRISQDKAVGGEQYG